jgi:hypothetical protein
MSYEFGWARYPMINRIKDVAAFTSMSVICGARSFIDTTIGQKIIELRRGSYVDVHVSEHFNAPFIMWSVLHCALCSLCPRDPCVCRFGSDGE